MPDQLPVRKYIRVWVKKRKNPPRKNGRSTISLTLEWVEYGQRFFMSLGTGATMTYATAMARAKEGELNSPTQVEALKPITWADFSKQYLDHTYPGHELPPRERREKARLWEKSDSSRRSEQRVLKDFARLVEPVWCHEVTNKDRENYIGKRLAEVPSPESVDADLRVLRMLFNVLESWKHITERSNPFSGKGRATIGVRRKREREKGREKAPTYFTRAQVKAILDQADREAEAASADWKAERLRALVYFEAYTGVRIEEALYLEWSDIDWETGTANINFKIDHDLKTEGSGNPIELPSVLIGVLRRWEGKKTCGWVFPNGRQRPWTGGPSGMKPLDQLKALARRAGVPHSNWKMFRHTLTTHAKQWFGLSAEQVKAQLRHTTTKTQEIYTHRDRENLHGCVKDISFD